MNPQRILLGTSALLVLSQPVMAIDADLYGSLRVGVEAVSPDGGSDDDYTGLRDAYSRVGIKITEEINSDWNFLAQVELPLDVANLDIHAPDDDEVDIRVAKVQVSGPLGTLWYGRGWLAYYNAIAYPVDYFSSYYSGFATLTSFRREKTLYYASPSFKGVSFAASTTDENGSGVKRNRNQYTLSYAGNGITLAAGLDDNVGATDTSIWGVAATYTTGPWYIAAKYEELDSDTSSSDGKGAKNLLVQYAIDDKNTVRGMVADVDAWSFGDTVLHLGWDHKYNDDLKVFVEYYQEESAAAISTSNDSFPVNGGTITGNNDGGQVITAGVRYDF